MYRAQCCALSCNHLVVIDDADTDNDAVAAAAARCEQLCRSPWQLGAGLVVPYVVHLPHAFCYSWHKHQQEVSQLLGPHH